MEAEKEAAKVAAEMEAARLAAKKEASRVAAEKEAKRQADQSLMFSIPELSYDEMPVLVGAEPPVLDLESKVDIYTEQIIATEAIRTSVMKIKARIQMAKNAFEQNKKIVETNSEAIPKYS